MGWPSQKLGGRDAIRAGGGRRTRPERFFGSIRTQTLYRAVGYIDGFSSAIIPGGMTITPSPDGNCGVQGRAGPGELLHGGCGAGGAISEGKTEDW